MSRRVVVFALQTNPFGASSCRSCNFWCLSDNSRSLPTRDPLFLHLLLLQPSNQPLNSVRNVTRPICCEYIKSSSLPPLLCGFTSNNNSNCFIAVALGTESQAGRAIQGAQRSLLSVDDKELGLISRLKIKSLWLCFCFAFPCSSSFLVIIEWENTITTFVINSLQLRLPQLLLNFLDYSSINGQRRRGTPLHSLTHNCETNAHQLSSLFRTCDPNLCFSCCGRCETSQSLQVVRESQSLGSENAYPDLHQREVNPKPRQSRKCHRLGTGSPSFCYNLPLVPFSCSARRRSKKRRK